MHLPPSIKSPTSMVPAAAALLCLVAMGWTVAWGLQLQMAHTIAGEPPQDMSAYWVLQCVLALMLLALLVLDNAIARPTVAQVCYRRRPLLESQVQRLALRQLVRMETRL